MRDDPFRVRVSDLLGRAGSRRQVVLSGDLPIALDQMEECGPVRADLRLEEVSGGVLVRGRVTAPMRLRCNRCAAPLAHPARASVLQAYGQGAEEDAFEIGDDGVIDLAGALRDELCLSVPLAPLCSETCRGLCPSCGSDLNTEPCGGHAEPSGSPFAALADVLDAAPRSPSRSNHP